MIVDGGLGVELTRRGFVYSTALWSGEAILSSPELLVDIHRAYLAAGAHVIETATYQLSHATLRQLGYDEPAIDAVFARGVHLAREAIAAHRAATGNFACAPFADAAAPSAELGESATYLVAGALGPYGATLGDGSEYSGAQRLDRDALCAFHAERARSMARAEPDVFLFETIPSLAEAIVVAEVARDLGLRRVWISLSCADAEHTYAGDPIARVAAELDAFACVEVVGVNCTAPQFVAPLVRAMRTGTMKPIFICPNLGQHWESSARALAGGAGEGAFDRCVPEWLDLGVGYIGGCCGVGPQTIAAIGNAIEEFQTLC